MAIVPAHHVRGLPARALHLEHLTTTGGIADVQAMHRDPITDRCLHRRPLRRPTPWVCATPSSSLSLARSRGPGNKPAVAGRCTGRGLGSSRTPTTGSGRACVIGRPDARPAAVCTHKSRCPVVPSTKDEPVVPAVEQGGGGSSTPTSAMALQPPTAVLGATADRTPRRREQSATSAAHVRENRMHGLTGRRLETERSTRVKAKAAAGNPPPEARRPTVEQTSPDQSPTLLDRDLPGVAVPDVGADWRPTCSSVIPERAGRLSLSWGGGVRFPAGPGRVWACVTGVGVARRLVRHVALPRRRGARAARSMRGASRPCGPCR